MRQGVCGETGVVGGWYLNDDFQVPDVVFLGGVDLEHGLLEDPLVFRGVSQHLLPFSRVFNILVPKPLLRKPGRRPLRLILPALILLIRVPQT